jgi:hypothetical protein
MLHKYEFLMLSAVKVDYLEIIQLKFCHFITASWIDNKLVKYVSPKFFYN